ncbi:xylulokinase [Aquibacillus saliphilus]|uniref:xylulokinase n=1 Tax=Aquibacillus saliphilus TaxID=1909422 RepID=UPI001CF010BF|nr:xylulokinase [Aquibacillus saliphilus]
MPLSTPLILAHDIGTSGVKATLFNTSGVVKGSFTSPYRTSYLGHNEVEQNPLNWWQAICESTNYLIKENNIEPSQINVVTFSGQMMGVVPVDKKGDSIHPAIIWADMRATKQANLATTSLGEDYLYHITGNKMTSSYSGPKIAWIKENKPKIYQATYKFLQAKDYIVAKLTGAFLTDYSDASGTNLFDIHQKKWCDDIIDFWKIDKSKLPDVVASTKVAGTVKEQVASEIGLLEGTPVVIGGADGSCAALGAGIVNVGDAFNYLGSSSWVAGVSDNPIIDEQKRIFNFIHLDDTKIMPIGTMQAAGTLIDWVITQWYRDYSLTDKKKAYQVMNQEIEQSTIGANGLTFLPYMLGERSPWWKEEIKASILGLTPEHKRGDFSRAAMEGITLNLRLILDALEESGLSMKEFWLFGGGANSMIWRQMVSDLFQKPINIPCDVEETTSKGAAIVGGIGVGLLKDFSVAKEWQNHETTIFSNQKTHKEYNELLNRFTIAYYKTEQFY